MKKYFINHVILASMLIVIFCIGFVQTAFAAFPTDWHYRKSHVINQATGAGTGYQVRITVHYGDDAGGSNDSGENVYLNSQSRADFGDVRFVSSDGVTELSYWMETGSMVANDSTIFWVKVNDDLSTASQTIYIYYGNTTVGLTTTSNGDNTFSFFDDFDGNLDKWAIEKQLAPGAITLDAAGYVRCGGGTASGTYGHTSLGSSPAYDSFTDGAIEVRLKQSPQALAEIAYRGNFVLNAGSGYKGRYDGRTGNESPHMRPPYYGWAGFGTAVPRFGIGTDTWYRGSVTVTSSGGSYTHRMFRNDVLMSTTTDTTYAGPGEIALQNHYGSYSDYDWVAVRKFVYLEPVHGVWGTEDLLAAIVYATKSVALSNDADGNGVITPGDTMRYNVKIYNTGNVVALGAELTDILPLETTYAVAWTATNGTVTYIPGSPGQISWTGFVTADPAGVIRTEITFDVTVNAGTLILPPDPPTVVFNQGTVAYDSDNDGANDPAANINTDGDPYMIGIQTTNFIGGGSAQATGTKTVSLKVDADTNGVITPGDTLEYEIVITNKTGFPSVGIEITDVIPAHTTYVVGSTIVTDRDGTSTTFEPSPPYTGTLLITGITIATAGSPSDVVTIKFQVTLDDPMASGVTQISNQAVGFYDSNSDGTNDTHQTTDGDLTTIGNQPTIANLYIGTISGTVFDDNGTGDGGIDGDGFQNGDEPGISGVTVNVYNALINLLYSTDLNGDYIFTGLPPGIYTVTETLPQYYALSPPTTNDVSVTLDALPATGDSAVVHFGNQVNGNADLMVVKNCTNVAADGTNQLVFVIIVTNEGPNLATNVELTDDLTSLITAGLTNIQYTLNGGARNAWTSPLTLGDMAISPDPSYSHTVRIYADVSETFSPEENTASVVSEIFDPTTGDNTSACINQLCPRARMAMRFNPAANAQVTVDSAPSLQLTTTGTIEAWIYVDEFQANSELIGKGTAAETFDIGLCGGGSGDEFEGGTAQNIGFALYDLGGNQHLFIADEDTLQARRWYHIACVWDLNASPQVLIYINGVEAATTTTSLVIPSVRTNTEDLAIGYNHLTGGRFIGTMDEVRIWNVARPLEVAGADNDLRDFMCKKLTGTETGLVGNWRFDEMCGVVCNDASAYDNTGITNAERVCSSAPIGDISMPDYDETGGFSVNFDYAAKDERLTVTGEVTADWDEDFKSGLQVYRVNTACCEDKSGPIGSRILTDIGYWGVFVTGGDGPTYKVQYTYDETGDGIPGVGSGTDLRLNWRHGNCEMWKNLNATSDPDLDRTLTIGGQTGTEFILGTDLPPRNAILFDGGDDYINVPDDASLDLTTDGTIEAWIYINNIKNSGIINKIYTTATPTIDGYSLSLNASGNIIFSLHNSAAIAPDPTDTTLTSDTILTTATWHHIAARWDGSAMNLYINGVLDANSINPSAQESGSTSSSDLTIATDNNTNYFKGQIDEVRVWNAARSQTDIRDTMCKKVTSADSGYANLRGYWRFDEETDSDVCPDETVNNNDGTMTGFDSNTTVPANLDPIRAFRICSSAPIGDDSKYDYWDLDTTGTVSVQLAHSDGDYMEVSENGVNWTDDFSGLHIYRVDEAPVYPPDRWDIDDTADDDGDGYDDGYDYQNINGLTPPSGWSSIDYYRYWGVFVTDWDPLNTRTPAYDLEYHYAGNPMVPVDDLVLGLARRPEYCFGTWTDSGDTPDYVNDILTITGDFQYGAPATNPEYVLGGKDAPLSITLASFTATADNGCVEIAWETATEINTAGFHVWRSDNPFTGFVRITGDMIASTSEMGTIGAKYSFQDCGVDFTTDAKYYYMLEEIEMDTTDSGNMHGPIGPVSETVTAAQGDGASNDKACFIGSLGWWKE